MQERNMPYTQAEAQPKMQAQGAAHMPYISHSQAHREIESGNRKTFFEYWDWPKLVKYNGYRHKMALEKDETHILKATASIYPTLGSAAQALEKNKQTDSTAKCIDLPGDTLKTLHFFTQN